MNNDYPRDLIGYGSQPPHAHWPGDARIAVFGMGRIGAGTYDTLRAHFGDTVIGLDSDPEKVAANHEAGRNVILGDATDSDFWERVQPGGIRLVMLTLLVPVAFLALDFGLLRGLSSEDPNLHTTRQAALVELGRLALADDEPDVAIARFRQALAARPDDEAPFLGLEGVYRERRAWAALFDLYKQRARATQGAARGRVMERVGALAAGALKRPDKAIEAAG